ncbi:uncharacterized protein FA14DRAFT_162232 [Meira miltonrushii]|uniref:Mannosyltransferase n=1 Tax=Meira miltonrushii TaxID=1280837 RepID=A0A316V9K3_9BASI|nr:uncharacterized protein FA14DRAFT_162232 [Meira miltonrushii]PWN33121.1 hypothetical protein FA14DRAFT_162232 [Meira miltonrushii]
MASIYLFNLPLVLATKLQLLDRSSAGHTFFAVQRFTFLFLSFVPDLCIAKYIGPSLRKRQKQAGLLIYAGSGAVLGFSCRPFSNNVESTVLFLCISLVWQLTLLCQDAPHKTKSSDIASSDTSNWLMISAALGILGAVGFFSRFTFAIFAFPVVLQFLRVTQKKAALHTNPFLQWFRLLLPGILGFIITSAVHVFFDTYFYSQSLTLETSASRGMQRVPIVPFNALKYNLQASNLAEHGIHPRWLHTVVNAPMILGLVPYLSLLLRIPEYRNSSNKERMFKSDSYSLEKLLMQTSAFSLIVLSIQAHQEPRFLLPLIAPASILCGIQYGAQKRSKVANICFWTIFSLQSFAMILLFCVAHQAGIIPSIFGMRTFLKTEMSEDGHRFLFWRTFMPPRHLLLPFLSSSADESNVKDLASISAQTALQIIKDNKETSATFNAPMWAIWQEKEAFLQINITLENALQSRWPHLDLDHVPESLRMWRSGFPLRLSFSYASWYLNER